MKYGEAKAIINDIKNRRHWSGDLSWYISFLMTDITKGTTTKCVASEKIIENVPAVWLLKVLVKYHKQNNT